MTVARYHIWEDRGRFEKTIMREWFCAGCGAVVLKSESPPPNRPYELVGRVLLPDCDEDLASRVLES